MSSAHDVYFVPAPSKWPVVGSTALFLLAVGMLSLLHWGKTPGLVFLGAGFAALTYMLFGWFGNVITESVSGKYNAQVDASFRWSMGWFIFSEVMFFAAFFGALFYARQMSVPILGDLDNQLLWPGFKPGWPSEGPYLTEAFKPMEAWGLPAVNTLLLLTSGVTLTWAHHALMANKRTQLLLGMAATIALGLTFLFFQATEYGEAAFSLSTGVYGATFFLLTGFHGFHVTLGTLMLIVIMARCAKGHFTPEHHFAFEAVAWYWHFVDVVWLGLFIFVYWM